MKYKGFLFLKGFTVVFFKHKNVSNKKTKKKTFFSKNKNKAFDKEKRREKTVVF
jgi:hypothetical protein